MSASVTCDGCKQPVEVPVVCGLAIRRDYCETCAARANSYMDEVEALRKASLDKFTEERIALISKFSGNGFLLPDVLPDVLP